MQAATSRCVVASHYDLLLLDGEGQSLQTWVLGFEDSRIEAVVVLHGEISLVGPVTLMAKCAYVRNAQLRDCLCEVESFSFPSFPHRIMDQATRVTQDRRKMSESLGGVREEEVDKRQLLERSLQARVPRLLVPKGCAIRPQETNRTSQRNERASTHI